MNQNQEDVQSETDQNSKLKNVSRSKIRTRMTNIFITELGAES